MFELALAIFIVIVVVIESVVRRDRDRDLLCVIVAVFDVVVVAMEVRLGDLSSTAAFAEMVRSGGRYGPRMSDIELDLVGLRFPPSALSRALGQQNATLALARLAAAARPRELRGGRRPSPRFELAARRHFGAAAGGAGSDGKYFPSRLTSASTAAGVQLS